ncbi:MAG: hypothetical protein C4B58_10475 [Deltaproteobacteria bacterium]|nr:MAG: hypothetical protein C4B58_10475 [Deltaproteobacteria bacterium]
MNPLKHLMFPIAHCPPYDYAFTLEFREIRLSIRKVIQFYQQISHEFFIEKYIVGFRTSTQKTQPNLPG